MDGLRSLAQWVVTTYKILMEIIEIKFSVWAIRMQRLSLLLDGNQNIPRHGLIRIQSAFRWRRKFEPHLSFCWLLQIDHVIVMNSYKKPMTCRRIVYLYISLLSHRTELFHDWYLLMMSIRFKHFKLIKVKMSEISLKADPNRFCRPEDGIQDIAHALINSCVWMIKYIYSMLYDYDVMIIYFNSITIIIT